MDEEEKAMGDLTKIEKSPGVFDISQSTININKNLEGEFGTSANSIQKFNINSKLDDLLSFDDVVKDNAKSAIMKSGNFMDDLSNKDMELSEIIGKTKTLHEKDELINNLLLVIKNQNVKIQDMENTSRANSAMLENVITKKKDHSLKIQKNVHDALYRLQKQDEYLDNLSDLSASTEGSKDNTEEEKKLNKSQNKKEVDRLKPVGVDFSIQIDRKPDAFPFGCQTNFANANELKIKELQELLVKQEEDFEAKLQEAKKMEDVEDAFQAFLDQLDLNENEERIIIDGESRVWKIIRCSKNIIEDECLEEEEEEDEEEKQIDPSTSTSNPNTDQVSGEIKEQLISRDRPSNPMHKLDSDSNEEIVVAATETTQSSTKVKDGENKEGILILEENVQDSDSNDNSNIQDELEGNIEDPYNEKKLEDPGVDLEKRSPSSKNNSIESSPSPIQKKQEDLQETENNDEPQGSDKKDENPVPKVIPKKNEEMSLLQKLRNSDNKISPQTQSEDLSKREGARHFPVLLDEGEHHEADAKHNMSPIHSDDNREELKTEDLAFE